MLSAGFEWSTRGFAGHGSPRPLDQLRIMVLEDPEAAPIRASYERAAGLGVDAFILRIEDRPADVALPLLDAAAALAGARATG
jgi:hypothetical protein